MDKRNILILFVSGIVAISLLLFSYIFLKDVSTLFSSLVILSIVIFVLPITIIKYMEISKIKSLEDMFPQFMNDLVETVRSGMTLPQAVHTIAKNDYGNLTPYIKKLDAQLEWGIPFSKAFLSFTKSTKSKVIGRIGSTIIETHEYGGNLTDVFESISNTTIEIERLREERKLYLNSQIVSGYIIFFVFIAVIIGLQKFLVPSLTELSIKQLSATEILPGNNLESEYKIIFRNLIIIQGFFAGITIGKMSEGEIISGIKHSLFLMFIGLIIFVLATG